VSELLEQMSDMTFKVTHTHYYDYRVARKIVALHC